MAQASTRIGIVGGGAWGTALATAARRAAREVVIWAREAEVVADINGNHRNTAFLPGIELDPAIVATASLADLRDCGLVLLVTPAQYVRAIGADLGAVLAPGTPVVICAKGIEIDSGKLMPDVAGEALPRQPLAMLSGPTFADEVARGLPTAVTIAAGDVAMGEGAVQALGSATFRPYRTDDIIGVALGGAIKNVLAIACGIVEGRGLGDNARAALLTRGFAEMARLGVAMGARPATLAGLAGMGDLSLTCNGPSSRNRSLGVAIGRGERAADFLAVRSSVAEGYHTARVVSRLAGGYHVDMPICAAVDAILHQDADVDATIRQLLARPFRDEGG